MNKIKFLIFIGAIALIWYLGRFIHINPERLENFFKAVPILYSGIIFILLYCGVTFFVWLSKDIFRLAAAIVFGAYFSSLFVFIAEVINAFILFHLSRGLGRGFVDNSLKGKLGSLDQRLGKLNFFWLFIFRSAPLIPFRFMDLACGLTRISFKKYLLAVILGSPLRIFWVQYILAGVGISVFNNPDAVAKYLVLNTPLLVLSLIYIVVVILAAIKMTQKTNNQ